MSKFSAEACEAVLGKVDMTQAGIQAASAKLLFWKRSAVEVVRCWERSFQRADMDKRLSLIYLVNDVVQTSRRSGREYTEAFHKALPEAFRHMMKHSDEKVQQKLKKLVLVWRDRNVWGNKALGLYLDMVRGVSINASPEVRPSHPPAPQHLPDPVGAVAGLFRELQQAQLAVQQGTAAESAVAASLKDIPTLSQGGLTLAQQQKLEEQLSALEKLMGARQKHCQIQESLNNELRRLADASASQLQSCTQLLQRDSGKLRDLQMRLSAMQGGYGRDGEAGPNARSLASAGLPPSAPDLMSGSMAQPAPHSPQAPSNPPADAPYTPSAPIPKVEDTTDALAAENNGRPNRRDPRSRAASGPPDVASAAATDARSVEAQVQDAEAISAALLQQVAAAEVDDIDPVTKHLASMAPAESAALLESIMRDAPAEIVHEFGTALVQQATGTQKPQG